MVKTVSQVLAYHCFDGGDVLDAVAFEFLKQVFEGEISRCEMGCTKLERPFAVLILIRVGSAVVIVVVLPVSSIVCLGVVFLGVFCLGDATAGGDTVAGHLAGSAGGGGSAQRSPALRWSCRLCLCRCVTEITSPKVRKIL